LSKIVPITTPYITLGQLLKVTGAIDTGGQVKWFLSEFTITVNGEAEQRRGKKLYPGDIIEIDTVGSFQIGVDS
jgi:ribosome-associated protein